MSGQESTSSDNPTIDQQVAQALPRLTPEQIAQVSPRLIRQTFAPGEVIIRQGDPPDHFYIMLAGQADVWHEDLEGEDKLVDTRRPGEYFGETGLLQNRPRSATVRASEEGEVEVLALNRQDFQALLDDSRATEMHVAQEMIQRLISLARAQ
jgi:CRP-like cAMP-binding protein